MVSDRHSFSKVDQFPCTSCKNKIKKLFLLRVVSKHFTTIGNKKEIKGKKIDKRLFKIVSIIEVATIRRSIQVKIINLFQRPRLAVMLDVRSGI